MKIETLNISEDFYSVQGEGHKVVCQLISSDSKHAI